MSILKLICKFVSVPGHATATIAPGKFNKTSSIQLSWDDGSNGPRLVLDTFKSLFYTDGCGNNIPYSGGLALTSGTGIPGDFGYNPVYWQASDLRTLIIDNNWDIINHTDTHGGNNGDADRHADVYNLEQRLILRVNYLTGFISIPDNYTGYTHEALIEGYTGINSTGDVTADELQPTRVYKLFPTSFANPYQTLFDVRDFNDEWNDAPSIAFCKTLIDDLGTGVRNYVDIGTHSDFTSGGSVDQTQVDGYISLLNYINTNNNDRYLVCSMRERLDYERMAILLVTSTLSGDTLTISIDTETLSDRTRWRDISFNVSSDVNLQSVTVDGFTSASFNPTTGLVNGFLQKTTWLPSSTPNEDFTLNIGKILISAASNPADPGTNNLYTSTEVEGVLFNSLVMGGYGTKYGANTITQIGEPQGSFKDLIGNKDISYVGISAPAVTGEPPVYAIPFGTRFDNNPSSNYTSNTFADMQPPYEMHHVIARLPGQNYEEFMPGDDNRGLVGDAGGTYRIINSAESNLPNPPANEADYYTVINLRLRVNANGTAQLWENNVSKGIYTFQNDDLASANAGTFTKKYNGVGVTTNVADYIFAQSGVVSRALTDSEALSLYNSSNSKFTSAGYPFGGFVTDLRFNNILWDQTGNVLTPSYSITNNTGKTLTDPSQWRWRWLLKTDQSNFATQLELGTTMTLPTTAYPANNGNTVTGAGVKVIFQAKYTTGDYDPIWTSGVFAPVPAGTGHS